MILVTFTGVDSWWVEVARVVQDSEGGYGSESEFETSFVLFCSDLQLERNKILKAKYLIFLSAILIIVRFLCTHCDTIIVSLSLYHLHCITLKYLWDILDMQDWGRFDSFGRDFKDFGDLGA